MFIPKNSTYSALWIAEPKVVYHSIHFSFHHNQNPFFSKNIPVQLLPNNHFDSLYKKAIEIEKNQFDKTANSFCALSAFFEILSTLLPFANIPPDLPFNKAIAHAIEYLENNYQKNNSFQQSKISYRNIMNIILQ